MDTISNPQWGFYGTMVEYDVDTACQALDLALKAIQTATSLMSITCMKFLQSRYGRHFAVAVVDKLYEGLPLEIAIQNTIKEWMTFIVSRDAGKKCGLRVGLPYLTSFALSLESDV